MILFLNSTFSVQFFYDNFYFLLHAIIKTYEDRCVCCHFSVWCISWQLFAANIFLICLWEHATCQIYLAAYFVVVLHFYLQQINFIIFHEYYAASVLLTPFIFISCSNQWNYKHFEWCLPKTKTTKRWNFPFAFLRWAI